MRRRSSLGATGSPCIYMGIIAVALPRILLLVRGMASATSTLPKPREPLSNRHRQLCASNIPLVVQVQARIQEEAKQRERAQAADELAAEPSASEAGLAGQSSQGTRLAWAT